MTLPLELRTRLPQAEVLGAIAEVAEVFLDPTDETAYGTVEVNGHRETWAVRTAGFKNWLTARFFDLEKKAPSGQALADALATVEARARFRGSRQRVWTRIAPGPDDSILIDLANEDWQAISITPTGWRLCSDPPVKFQRRRGMLPLPGPARGGSLQDLRRFVNVTSEDQLALILGWLIGAARPVGPYPVLVLLGEQGSAKSTAARIVRRILDPNTTDLRAEPTDLRDLMIAATNGWIVTVDNVSRVPTWLSDGLCRLATGGGFATRALYTDRDEVLFTAQRPVILNGIEQFVWREDLLDRSLVTILSSIPDSDRRPERDLWAAFDAALPMLLGALCDAVSVALQRVPTTALPALPRMADFATWVTAAAPALGWTDDYFLTVYRGSIADAGEAALDMSPVGTAVLALAEKGDWIGSATELLTELAKLTTDDARRERSWPKTANVLSGALRRAAPQLRNAGVEVKFDYREPVSRKRLIAIRPTAVPAIMPGVVAAARTDRTDGTDEPGPFSNQEEQGEWTA